MKIEISSKTKQKYNHKHTITIKLLRVNIFLHSLNNHKILVIRE